MIWLPDGNILAALVIQSHAEHQRARAWFHGSGVSRFATCAVTQGTLLRLYLRFTASATSELAWEVLKRLEQDTRHEFWDEGFSYLQVSTHRLQGQRQVTDFWLAELARRHGGKLVTLDQGLAVDQPDVAVLIP